MFKRTRFRAFLNTAALVSVLIPANLDSAMAIEPSTIAPQIKIVAPTNRVAPAITGIAKVPNALTVSNGTWQNTPTSFTYSWFQCTSESRRTSTSIPRGCTAISGATSATYTLPSSLVGRFIVASVRASNSSGNRQIWTASTSAVAPEFVPPVNTVAPVVSGLAAEGNRLLLSNGTWQNSPTSFTYVWYRCTANQSRAADTIPAACSAIPGATTSSLTLTTDDVGRFIAGGVTASTSNASSFRLSVSTRAVTGLPAPSVDTAPAITGTARVDESVTLSSGSWTSAPTSYAYSWFRCSSAVTRVPTSLPRGCVAISGATESTYLLTGSELSRFVIGSVVATNRAGSRAAFSLSTGSIAQATRSAPRIKSAPKVDIQGTGSDAINGRALVGSVLVVNKGQWLGFPTPQVSHDFWYRCADPVPAGQSIPPAFCFVIPGSQGNLTYAVQEADIGYHLAFEAIAVNDVAIVRHFTATTDSVSSVPISLSAPNLSGSTDFQGVLTLSNGRWASPPTIPLMFDYYWFRCEDSEPTIEEGLPLGCDIIPGATAKQYQVTQDDLGYFVHGTVVAFNDYGFAAFSTAPSIGESRTAPVNLFTPAISGEKLVGSELSASNGQWAAYPAATTTLQWFRCDTRVQLATNSRPPGCEEISGATRSTYTQTREDAGKFVSVASTVTNILGTAVIWSTVTAPTNQPPTLVTDPTISGTSSFGSTLTANSGSWEGFPTPTFSYQWYSCDNPVEASSTSLAGGCSLITGSTSSSRVLNLDTLVGKRLLVRVTAINSLLSSAHFSASTDPITRTPVATVNPSVSGTRTIGSDLTASPGTWSAFPEPTTSYQWFRCTSQIASVATSLPSQCSEISGATSISYSQVAADAGRFITVRTNQSNDLGTANLWSIASAPTNQPPTLVSDPILSGTASFGSRLQVGNGSWAGFPILTSSSFRYQWYSCDNRVEASSASLAGGCSLISGSTNGFDLNWDSVVGKHLLAQVTATNTLSSSSRFTSSLGPITRLPFATVNPTVSGTRTTGSVLTASPGTWSAFPVPTTSYQWFRCVNQLVTAATSLPSQCSEISGATSTVYTQVTADVGRFITVRSATTNSLGTTNIWSMVTSPTNQPTNLVNAPQLAGTALYGSNLVVTPGTWQGFPTPGLSYQWYSCNEQVTVSSATLPSGCSLIASSTSTSQLLNLDWFVGRHLLARVTATNALLSIAHFTATIGPVNRAPTVLVNPAVSGTRSTGNVLTVNTGTWSAFPAAVASHQWFRCTSQVPFETNVLPSGCSEIPDATAATYTQSPADAGMFITARTTQINSLGTTNLWSSANTPTNHPPTLETPPSISGAASYGDTLNAGPGTWKGFPAPTFSYEWYTCSDENPSPRTTLPSGCQEFVVEGGDVATGANHSCATLSNGTVRCWGFNGSGQLGNNSTTGSLLPVAVSGLTTAKSISTSHQHTCALLANGTVQCWGSNSSGQLGNGGNSASLLPAPVRGISTATSISAGANHTCATVSNGTVQCWGMNLGPEWGHAGNPSPMSTSYPVEIPGVSAAVSISTGHFHTCALLANGTVRCWGSNNNGQLGNNSMISSRSPVTANVSNVTQISSGTYHTCALLANSTVQCWGDNGSGRLGNNNVTHTSVPTVVPGLTGVASISTGDSHSCALLSNGTVRCWGANSQGQLGSLGTTFSSAPVSVSGISSATEISAGRSHTCAQLSNGTVQCWGENGSGQLGNNTATRSLTPVNTGLVIPFVVLNKTSIGKFVVVRVTARNSASTSTIVSRSTNPVTRIPTPIANPTVSGIRTTGRALTVSTGAWSAFPEPTTSFQWFRCTSQVPADTNNLPPQCDEIAGESSATYTQVPDDAGKFVSARTTQTNTVGTANLWVSATEVTTQPTTLASEPAISGTASFGSILTSNPGAWQGFPSPTFNYQWYSCDIENLIFGSSVPAGCQEIVGSSQSITLSGQSAGKYVIVRVTAANPLSTVVRVSRSTGQVTQIPTATVNPAVSGTRTTERELTVSPGTWSAFPEPTTSYQWFRCTGQVPAATTNLPSQCSDIAGATSTTYRQVPADAGRFITVRTAKTNSLGTTNLWSSVTEASTQPPTLVSDPSISGAASSGSTLTANPGVWQGFPDVSISYSWFECSSPLFGASSTLPDYCEERATPRALSVDNGSDHSCALLEGGDVACWGKNTAGQIGDGTFTNRPTPVLVPLAAKAQSVSAGFDHSCALLTTGQIQCWGAGANGELGNGTNVANSPNPVLVSGLTTAVELSVGGLHTCALLASRTVHCWGYNWSGQLGNGQQREGANRNTPQNTGLSGVKSLSAGGYHTCAVMQSVDANGRDVRCWGSNGHGQIGHNVSNANSVTSPTTALTPNSPVISLSSGAAHTCAVFVGGSMRCWGKNESGQLGNGSVALRVNSPVAVLGGLTATTISSGEDHTCAILSNNSVQCWGANHLNQWSVSGVSTNSPTAVVVSNAWGAVSSISTGGRHSCVLTSTGTISCSGPNGNGELGDGSTTKQGGFTKSWTPPFSVIGSSQLGKYLVAGVTATNSLGSVTRYTMSTAQITAIPTVVTEPAVSGTRVTGNLLTVSEGSWVAFPEADTSHQWFRCVNAVSSASATLPSNCAEIPGATSTTYRQVADDASRFITVRTTKTNTVGTTNRWAVATVATTQPPTVTADPSLSGTASLSSIITANPGTWQGSTPLSFSYQWFACDARTLSTSSSINENCVSLSATSTTYQVQQAALGKFLVAAVTVSNSAGTVTRYTMSTIQITAIPTVITEPTVSGTRVTGNDLTVSSGTWVAFPEPTTTVQWFRCTNAVASASASLPSTCSEISGATATTYRQVAADAGRFLTARTSKTNSIGTTNRWAAATSATGQPPTNTSDPSLSGTATRDSVITANPGSWQGSPALSFSYQWFACDEATSTSSRVLPDGCVDTGVSSVASFGNHSCSVLEGGSVQCWGANGSGQLGNGTTVASSVPVNVQNITNAVSVSTGDSHSCALLATGAVQCWGSNSSLALGTGSTTPGTSAVPVSVSSVTNAVSISLGANHSCAALATGSVVCWGANASGQLGDSSTTSRSTRVTVSGVAGVSSISAGGTHTCAVLSTGVVRCWGNNSSGQLGNLSVASNSVVSVQVEGLDSAVRAIQSGTASSCALLQTGSIQCWGAGARGELGNGLGSSSLAPVTVSGITNAAALAMGGSTSCAILQDATVQCWGNGDFGKLGNGDSASTSQALIPVTVSGLSDAENISVGLAHVCSVTTSGVLKCWGRNNLGQLGSASPAASSTPLNATRVLSPFTSHRIGSRSVGKYLIVRVVASNTLATENVYSRSTALIAR